MDFVIAIPSYQRQDKLKAKTLSYLAKEGVTTDRIYVFVADPTEYQLYKNTLDPTTYGHLIIGHPTIARQRTFICEYFPLGQRILMIDDDIKQIKFLHPKPLLSFAKTMFNIAEENNLTLWGIQPANNLYFCRERVSVGKLYIIACFMGLINTKDIVYPEASACEDRWHSLTRFKRDGATLRYDGACPDTTYFTKGGLSEYRQTRQKQDCEIVASLFPHECELKQRKDGFWDVVWRNIRFREINYDFYANQEASQETSPVTQIL